MTAHSTHSSHHPHKQPEENGLAIASLILGVTSLVGMGALTGIAAIITGVMSRKNPHRKEMGLAGIIMGSISTALSFLVLTIAGLFFLFAILASSTAYPEDYGPIEREDPRMNDIRSQST